MWARHYGIDKMTRLPEGCWLKCPAKCLTNCPKTKDCAAVEVKVELTPSKITHVSVKSQNLKAQFRSLEIRIIRHQHLIFHDLLVNRNMDTAALFLPPPCIISLLPHVRRAQLYPSIDSFVACTRQTQQTIRARFIPPMG